MFPVKLRINVYFKKPDQELHTLPMLRQKFDLSESLAANKQ